jgi:hypothetical protein
MCGLSPARDQAQYSYTQASIRTSSEITLDF